jgi:hypothetical protein
MCRAQGPGFESPNYPTAIEGSSRNPSREQVERVSVKSG